MDWVEKRGALQELFKKYKWAAVVVLMGMMLMAFPSGKEEAKNQPVSVPEHTAETDTLELRLENLLSRLEGAGKVKVLLSIASGSEKVFQTDEDRNQTEDSLDKRQETVLITTASREENGLIRRVDPPVYLGAVVLCQGADRASIRLAVVEAVSTATGLGANHISVLKMK